MTMIHTLVARTGACSTHKSVLGIRATLTWFSHSKLVVFASVLTHCNNCLIKAITAIEAIYKIRTITAGKHLCSPTLFMIKSLSDPKRVDQCQIGCDAFLFYGNINMSGMCVVKVPDLSVVNLYAVSYVCECKRLSVHVCVSVW